jgi:alginate O-acetyltransferase complex protein AlgI
MLFNTLEFALFFLAVYGLYLALPHRGQNLLLLVASYVFYAAWNWRFLGLIVLSTVVDYFVGVKLGATDDPRRRKRLVAVSVVTNLGILAAFKYAGFFADSLSSLASTLGWEMEPWVLDVALPVGISFYTFQTLSYSLDVYRGACPPTRRFLDFALFVSFFPQLVAGPIERASRLLPQILKPRKVSWEGVGSGCWLILFGLFKKVVVADNLGALVDPVYADPAAATGPEVVVATWVFAWQIYCDFSGYSNIARGLSRLMGFELMLNFDLPYLATSPADFWRRWHISLSTWLRDYLYIPLGGNRGGGLATARNLALTMLLGGLWHGAAWTFVLWGAYQGALLMVHRALQPWLASWAPAEGWGARVWWLLRVAVMFQLACAGWMIFRAESAAQLGELLSRVATDGSLGAVASWLRPLSVLVLPLALFQLVQRWRGDLECVLRLPVPLRALCYVVLFYGIVLLGEDFGAPFLYFQF